MDTLSTVRTHMRVSSESDAGKKPTTSTQLQLYGDDLRISKILRRLQMEHNPDTAKGLCKKLETAVRSQQNASYICRSFDFLLDNLVALLKQSRTECSEHLAVVLGLVGYINRADFPIFKNYITKSYHSSKNIQKYLMLALKTTFNCDVNLELSNYSGRIIVLLQDFLENAELAEHFIAVSEAIAAFSKNYGRAFEEHFRDIVDIIVGWHLEVEQPHAVKLHCSSVLQQFSVFFLNELNFTLGLLGQFMEDIEGFEEDAARKDNSEERIGTFIGAFTSVLKALATRNEIIGLSVGHTMLSNAVEQIFKSALQCLAAAMPSEETVLNVNDFLCLLLTYKYNQMSYAMVEEIIELELKQLDCFNDSQTTSLLYLILCFIRELKTALPRTLVTLIFRIDHNPLTNIKMHKNASLKKLLMKIYQEVLMIKNVRLLQEVYKHTTLDIDRCMNTLEDSPESRHTYEIAQAEMILTFYLSALSVLATQTSSIIGMYALRPSILEVLITQCKAADMEIWKKHETLHFALLNLLVAHCQKNHNFRPTSTLLMETPYAKHPDDTNSPTSENFNAILKFLSEVLSFVQIISVESLKLLQNWLKLLLTECKSSANILQNNPYFVSICKSIAISGRKLPLECAPCIKVLLTYTPLNDEALEYIRDLAMEHIMNADDPEVKAVYTAHIGRLPLMVLFKPAKYNAILDRRHKVAELNQWYHSSAQFAALRNKFFATFLEMIKISADMPQLSDHDVTDIFVKCWTVQFRGQLAEFQQMALQSPIITSVWLPYEVARYCVQNKLRTTVGKPQDTFLAIEAIIMRYARIIAAKDDFPCKAPALLANQKRIRMLLAFLENLEKVIYNAAEGTAFAIPPAEKPAKSFFRINEHTCKEWFKRIRPGVNLIALHSMEDEMVIRYSEEVIKSGKLGDASLDHTVTALVWALLRRGESDALHGLHIFLKAHAGKRYVWIQHASEQAAGHKELAAKGYSNYMQENETKLDANTKEFLLNQLLDCQYYTGQWLQSSKLVSELTAANSVYIYNLRPHAHLQVLDYLFNGGGDTLQPSEEVSEALMNLTEWPADEECKANLSFCNTYRTLEDACEKMVMSQNQNAVPHEIEQLVQMSIQEGVHHGELTMENRQLSEFIILHHAYQKLIDGGRGDDNSFDCSQTVSSSTILTKCLVWNLLYEHRFQALNGPRNQSNLYLDIAACARREGNYNYCNASLRRFFSFHGFEEPQTEILEKIRANSLVVDLADNNLMRGYGEMAKCLYEQSVSQQMNAINIGSGFCYQVKQQLAQDTALEYPEACASMLLTMADWISQRGTITNGSSQLQRLLETLPDIPVHYADEKIDALIQDSEKAVGKLLSECIVQRNDSGEAWYAFGNWCYRWGKKIVEAKQANSLKHRSNLSQHDLLAIKRIVGDINEADMKHLVDTLNGHELNANDCVEDIETNEFNSSEILEMELKKLELFADKPAQHLDSVINIWRQSHRSIYAYYELATKAYFKYLSIAAEDMEPKKNSCQVGDSTFVTTTLRLLRLIVKHAIGLQETLEEGFRSTPLRPWKVIIPQLFSRLNHHEPYVRESVADLLCRLAEDRPHLVIFPAVVGAQQELKRITSPTHLQRTPSNLQLEDLFNDITIAQREPKQTTLSTCFSSLVNTLSGLAPQAVLHVQLLVKELKRIALLWEEYWMHSLAQLYGEYSPLFVALESEFKKATEMQMDIIKKKHAILIRHAVADLKKIAFVTDKPAETSYEHNFQQRFQEIINNAIATLENPATLGRPIESWQKIKELYTSFQQRSLRSSPSTLKISDLSPVLAAMEDTPIAMPGVDTFEKHPIHIKSVDSTVYILPTKTKPKKLAFFGSNGVKYTYLFKGLEDLHLDERIMQFLSISNSMMARSGETPTFNTNAFKAHHYSVIPLGPQSGLISWVDGVTPLFSIYKKWQQRDIAIKQQQKERPTNKQNNDQIVVPPTRPSELFYNKLTPLLTEHNLKVSDPRKLWPIQALRRVLSELSEETPKDLLAKELWCHAINAAEWRKSVRNYSISVAVMSVIGYVIGLGDRHLDNVLIRLNTGEIVHIDYNVCFEKGKTLRVPEKVPFRMTPNLREALGITGVEGIFRLSCEHVLKTLRKERETLLTLLEAFVYDPLVDWTLSDDGSTTAIRMTSAHLAVQCINNANFPVIGSSRESMKALKQESSAQKKPDWKSTRQLIEKRFNDIKPQWQRFRNDVHSNLKPIAIVIKQLQNNRKVVRQTEQERDILTKQTAMIRELNALGSAMGSHALNTITQRYKVFKQDTEAFAKIKQTVKAYNTDVSALISAYFERVIIEPHKNRLTYLQMQLNEQREAVYANEFVLIRELFRQQEQQQIADEGELLRVEMENSIGKASLVAGHCLKLFLEYVGIMQLYPRSRFKRSRLMLSEVWSRQMLDDKCDPKALKLAIRNHMQEEVSGAERRRSQARDYSVALGKIYAELNSAITTSIINPSEQNEQQEFSMDEIMLQISDTLAENPVQYAIALQLHMLTMIQKANDEYRTYEEAAFENGEDDILDNQILYTDMILGMWHAAFTDRPEADHYEPIQALRATLQSLQQLRALLDVPSVENIVHLFMLDDNVDVRRALDIVCESSMVSNDLQAIEALSPLISSFLEEVFGRFNEFKHNLKNMGEMSTNGFAHKKNYLLKPDMFEETVSKIFSAVRENAVSLIESSKDKIYDIRNVLSPLNAYISYVEKNFLKGLTPNIVHTLRSKYVASASWEPDIQQIVHTNAFTLCENLYGMLKHNFKLKSQNLKVVKDAKLLKHHIWVLSAHYWAHEYLLKSDSIHATNDNLIFREHLLGVVVANDIQLRTWRQTSAKIQDALEVQATAASEILQRVAETDKSWASLESTFLEITNIQRMRFMFYTELATQLNEHVNLLIKTEDFMNANFLDMDQTFMRTLEQYEEAQAKWLHSHSLITPVEQRIVQLLDPEGNVDHCWIENISGLLDEMTYAVQRKLVTLEREEQLNKECIIAVAQHLQTLIDSCIRSDMRQLLKMLLKNDKIVRYASTDPTVLTRIREFQQVVRGFYNELSELHLLLISKEYTPVICEQIQEKASELLQICTENHDELLQVIQNCIQQTVDGGTRPMLTLTDSQSNSNKDSPTTERKVINPEQKRNAYAVSVWKRIRIKLEGRDPDPNRRTVAEQVEFIINEAMNPDNLAVLYEGWTPWV